MTKRLLALAVSTAISMSGLLLFLHHRPTPSTVIEIDITPKLKRLLRNRHRGATDLRGFVDDRGDPVLVREGLSEGLVRIFFPVLKRRPKGIEYDPLTYVKRRPDLRSWQQFDEHPAGGWGMLTNGHGFGGSRDLLDSPPPIRILVAGDSHVEGLVSQNENLTSVLERRLSENPSGNRVEVLNAGLGGTSFFNYLGVIEKYSALEPDVFVMVIYGGNDFVDVLPLTRYFYRLPHRGGEKQLSRELREIGSEAPGMVPQWLRQIVYFARFPEDRGFALHAAVACTLEAGRVCAASGIDFLCVYLPASMAVQPRLTDLGRAEIGARVGLEDEDLDIPDELANAFLRTVEDRGVRTVDLRDEFRAADELLYWKLDQHLNIDGHRRTADRVAVAIRDCLVR